MRDLPSFFSVAAILSLVATARRSRLGQPASVAAARSQPTMCLSHVDSENAGTSEIGYM